MSSEKETVNKLLTAIHEYYPIGIPNLGVGYPGYAKYSYLLTQKINAELNNEITKWEAFNQMAYDELKIRFFDMNYLQFPCHLAKMEFVHDANDNQEFRRSLVVNVSLLCNYYTIYFEDVYVYKNYTNDIIKPKTTILFSEIVNSDFSIQSIKNIIVKLFPDYEYVHHKILFQHKVMGGHPYTDDAINDEYNIYNFLFDGYYISSQIHIMD